MNLLDVQNQIINLMAQFYAQIRGATYIGRTDFNKVSETVLIPLLSEVYGYSHLRNLNTEKVNFPGIDLGDDYARVAYQVTATADGEKVKDTLQKFVDHGLYKDYDRLVVYILTEKQSTYSDKPFQDIIDGKFSFDISQDIIDYRDVLNTIKDFQLDKAIKVQKILETNFIRGDVVLYQEEIDARKEDIFLNLIPISFPSCLYIAQVSPNVYEKIKRKKDKRKGLQDELKRMGEKFASDWEYFEGKIITFHDLPDEALALFLLIDKGSVEEFNTEDFYLINKNYERIFKSLLRRCLQQKLYHRNVLWQHKEHLFVFIGNDDELIRKEHWRGKVEDDRVVFEKTMKNNKPDEILRCKHFAFSVEFKFIENQWFLLVKPDWFFSWDGYQKSAYSEENMDWIKRQEKNPQVFAHLRFISYFLSDPALDLFGNRKPYPFLTFGRIVEFDNASYLDDRGWLPKRTMPDDQDESASQMELWG